MIFERSLASISLNQKSIFLQGKNSAIFFMCEVNYEERGTAAFYHNKHYANNAQIEKSAIFTNLPV